MATSSAKIAANQRNAQQSTGPKTPEGKAASRRNALQHGMAGAGDLLSPGEDAALVARRTVSFALELDAKNDVAQILAHRAALLSVRMEKLADRSFATEAAAEAEARDEFDRERLALLDSLIERLNQEQTANALADLEQIPEGVDFLVVLWPQLLRVILSPDTESAGRGKKRVETYLGRQVTTPRDLVPHIDAEITRLQILAEAMAPLKQAIAAARRDAGLVARFDPGPEAILARRYEAAAERGMYRAMKELASLRRSREQDPSAILLPPPALHPAPVAIPPTPPTPLGSFRAGVIDSIQPLPDWLTGPVEPSVFPVQPRAKRPDSARLGQPRR